MLLLVKINKIVSLNMYFERKEQGKLSAHTESLPVGVRSYDGPESNTLGTTGL